MATHDSTRPGLTPEQIQWVMATLATPDVVDSPFGQPTFVDGVPAPDSVVTIYDGLDLLRGVDGWRLNEFGPVG